MVRFKIVLGVRDRVRVRVKLGLMLRVSVIVKS